MKRFYLLCKGFSGFVVFGEVVAELVKGTGWERTLFF